MRRVILLGPQRHQPIVREAVDSLGLPNDARIATITAGWEEREPEDLELGEHLGGRAINLGIHRRGDETYQRDPELHTALRRRHDRLRRLQDVHRLRLGHALEAARELLHMEGDASMLGPERDSAIEAVRELDRQHLARVLEIHGEFEDEAKPLERDSVRHHHEELRHILNDVGALCIAGGHVGILVNRVRLFGIPSLVGDRPLIGWSGGAMALSERIVLFHDSPPQGPGNAEVFGPALGLCRGVVPLPHASDRLRLDDTTRVSLFARRFRPDLCVALDAGRRIDWDGENWTPHHDTEQLAEGGQLVSVGGDE